MGVRAIGINHVAFEVDDLDQALQWYGRYFDFALRGRHPTMAWIDLGDQFLALSQRPEAASRHRIAPATSASSSPTRRLCEKR